MQLLENPIQTTIGIGALHSTVLQDDQFADLIRNENLAIHFLDFIDISNKTSFKRNKSS